MPTTVNGIGTHYYGRRNLHKRPGACPHCGRNVELSSYDTRLWFVVVFIPIIPLARKRIVDACPVCTRHYAIEAEAWETAKQLEVSGALDTYRSTPTPENAIAAHQQLLQYHQFDQATTLRQELAECFAGNALVQTHMGTAMEHLGRLEEATPFYERALALRPDLPAARVGVAQARIRAGRLDDARKLLDLLERPGAAQLYSLQPLETLAIACQKANRHAEALELYRAIIRELPEVAQVPAFRKAIKQSEKALARRDSILPKAKFNWRRRRGLVVLGAILALAAIGMIVANEWIRRHRTVHIVSGLSQQASLEIRGVTTMRVKAGLSQMVLPEGQYRAVVSGVAQEQFDFEVRGDYWSRWFDEPAWVLDVGGASVLMVRQVVYRHNPPPARTTFHFGQPFYRFPEVTHAFCSLPTTLQLESGSERTLWQLERFTGASLDLFYHLTEQQPAEALRFAEYRLRHSPADEALFTAYLAVAEIRQLRARAVAFVHEQLPRRPVEIAWHRAYQNFRRDTAHEKELIAEYDAMLQAEPANAALMYLRGRVTADCAESRSWFERARAADPQNPYPLFALAYDLVSSGNWAAARPLLARAVELLPAQPQFDELLFTTRCALGEYAALEPECREHARRNPLQMQHATRLADVLLAQDRKADAEKALQAYQASVRAQAPESASQVQESLRQFLLYRSGDFAALEKETAADLTPNGLYTRFVALVEQGKPAAAAKVQPPNRSSWTELSLAIAWGLAGNDAEAARCRAWAAKEYATGTADQQRAAAALTKTEPPSQEELDQITLQALPKALLLAALAQAHPSRRTEFAAAARRLNVNRDFPYHLLQRATAAVP